LPDAWLDGMAGSWPRGLAKMIVATAVPPCLPVVIPMFSLAGV
jgi:hypothetical protein